jgi:hypothetical protein
MLVSGFTGMHQTHARSVALDAIAHVAEKKEALKAQTPADGISIELETIGLRHIHLAPVRTRMAS